MKGIPSSVLQDVKFFSVFYIVSYIHSSYFSLTLNFRTNRKLWSKKEQTLGYFFWKIPGSVMQKCVI